MDGGAWWAAVHGVAKSRTQLSDFTFTFHFYALEKEMATHSSVLVWRIPGTGEPGGLPSMGPHRVGHDWSDLAAAAATYTGVHVLSLYGICDNIAPVLCFGFSAGRYVGSQLPDQGPSPQPLHWKVMVLTTGLPGKSLECIFKVNLIPIPIICRYLQPVGHRYPGPQGLDIYKRQLVMHPYVEP